jgi:K+-sensing histidine kinase KdpD
MPKMSCFQPRTASASVHSAHRRDYNQGKAGRSPHASELIHAITTAFASSPEAAYDQVVLATADMLQTPLTMVHEFEHGRISRSAQVYKGRLLHMQCSAHCYACSRMTGSTATSRFACTKSAPSVKASCFPHGGFQSFLGAPIHDPAGVLVGAVCAFDERERKFSDNEAHFVALFARYLTDELARRRRETLDKLSVEQNLLSRLALGITHEVRNRLNGICANTEAIFQNIGDHSELHMFQGHIRQQIAGLATLMENLLALGKPIAKEDISEVSIYSLISEALLYWRQSVPGTVRKVNLSLFSPEHVTVKADGARLKQAFINLLANAHEHTPDDGEVRLSVSSVRNQWARIRIAHSGSGIPPEQLSRAFEPFFFAGKSGAGLGLSIVKHIVECHGGTVSMFNNSPPPGFTVELNLPLAG